MRTSNSAIVYYLFFALQKPVAMGIVEDIFNSYRFRIDYLRQTEARIKFLSLKPLLERLAIVCTAPGCPPTRA